MASAFVNAHITKALAAGADGTTIDATWLGDAEDWLNSEGLMDDLEVWLDPAWGTTKDGSNIISRIEIIGKDRMGWYTPQSAASNTTYSATGLNSAVPAWTNNSSSAFGYFGGTRYNNIRRKTGLTLVAAFQKSGTSKTTLIASGEFGGFALQNTAGNPGTANVFVGGFSNAWSANAVGANLTNGTAHVIGGTITASEAIAYVEGVTGTPAACTNGGSINGLLAGTSGNYFLGCGSTNSKNTATDSDLTGTYTFSNNEASYTASDLIVFGTALSGAQMASLNTLLRDRIGA